MEQRKQLGAIDKLILQDPAIELSVTKFYKTFNCLKRKTTRVSSSLCNLFKMKTTYSGRTNGNSLKFNQASFVLENSGEKCFGGSLEKYMVSPHLSNIFSYKRDTMSESTSSIM